MIKESQKQSLRILIIESEEFEAERLQRILDRCEHRFTITWASNFKQGLGALFLSEFDIVLTDLFLSDSYGMETFHRIQERFPELPIIIVTEEKNKAIAMEALEYGAQDHVIKYRDVQYIIERVIVFAYQRNKWHRELRRLAMTDELTKLNNRRGFMTLAKQHMKLARRQNKEFLLFFADLDGLKQINDQFGHEEGDRAITKTANVLKQTFRESDIVARLGGDEFAILAVETEDKYCHQLKQRLEENLKSTHDECEYGYSLSLSVDAESYNPKEDESLDSLLAKVDEAVYKQKKAKDS